VLRSCVLIRCGLQFSIGMAALAAACTGCNSIVGNSAHAVEVGGSGGAAGADLSRGTAGAAGSAGSGPQSMGPHLTVSAVMLDHTQVVTGVTLAATVTYTNDGPTDVTLLTLAIAARPPGGTHAGGPFSDLYPHLMNVALAAGQSITQTGARTFTASDSFGIWEAYATYQDASGWHDQTSVFFEYLLSAGSGDASGTGGLGGG